MALSQIGSTGTQEGGTPLVVTFTTTSPVGFTLGDEFFFAYGNGSGGVNVGGADFTEAFTSNDDDWISWNFHPVAVPTLFRLQLYTFAFSPGDSRIGDTSITFTFTGGSSGGIYALSGGLVAGGVVIRGGAGATSEHTNTSGGLIPSSGNDYAEASSILSTATATVPVHSQEAGASGYQIESFMLAGANHTTTQNITGVTLSVGQVGTITRSDSKIALAFGYELRAQGVSTESTYSAVATWVTGAGGTIRDWTFRVVRLVILENPPVAAFTLTQIGQNTAKVDMSASSDAEDTIPDSWDVNWGDGHTTSGLDRGAGVITSTHVYATDGLYTVTVTVYDLQGLSDSTSHTIYFPHDDVIWPSPEADQAQEVYLEPEIPTQSSDVLSTVATIDHDLLIGVEEDQHHDNAHALNDEAIHTGGYFYKTGWQPTVTDADIVAAGVPAAADGQIVVTYDTHTTETLVWTRLNSVWSAVEATA